MGQQILLILYKALLPINLVIHHFCHFFGIRLVCKFSRSCSQFTLEELRAAGVTSKNRQSLLRSLSRIVLRLIACSPLFGCFEKAGIVKNLY